MAATVTRVVCPHCTKGLAVGAAQFGVRLRCPDCRQVFVPAAPGLRGRLAAWVSRLRSGR